MRIVRAAAVSVAKVAAVSAAIAARKIMVMSRLTVRRLLIARLRFIRAVAFLVLLYRPRLVMVMVLRALAMVSFAKLWLLLLRVSRMLRSIRLLRSVLVVLLFIWPRAMMSLVLLRRAWLFWALAQLLAVLRVLLRNVWVLLMHRLS